MSENTVIQYPKALKLLSELQADITRAWSAALKLEGFGKVDRFSKIGERDVSWELESIEHYTELAAFYGEGQDDRDNRERFLVDYVTPIFSYNTLARTIIPRKSFVRKVVHNVAMLYKQAPTRWLEDAAQKDGLHIADGEYTDTMNRASIKRASKMWHRKFTLTRCVVVMPVMIEEHGRAKLRFRVMTPDEFRVMVSADGVMEKLLYCADVGGETRIAVWTASEHYYRDAHGEKVYVEGNEQGTNPYGRIPAALITDDPMQPYSGGLFDLVEANKYHSFVELLQTDDAAFAALKAWVATNMDLAENEVVSPRRLFAYDDQVQAEGRALPAKLEVVETTPNAAILRDLMTAIYRGANVAEGISPAMLEAQGREMSARAIKELNAELYERRADDADTMEEAEREIYDATRVYSEKNKVALKIKAQWPDGDSFRIDFADTTPDDKTLADVRDQQTWEMENGFTSVVDVFREYNDDMDDEAEILARIKKNKADTAMLQRAGLRVGLLSGLLADNPAEDTPEDNTEDARETARDDAQGANVADAIQGAAQ